MERNRDGGTELPDDDGPRASPFQHGSASPPQLGYRWTGVMVELSQWLAGLGLEKYLPQFEANQVDLADVPHLTAEDLREIGLPVGPRRRFLTAAAEMSVAPHDPTVADVTPEATSPVTLGAELRTMSVMFCDLVGSTSLSGRLGVEELRTVMQSYTAQVRDVVELHGGHVAKYLGDGVLAYFGWPEAHEDQAARSVRAGLQIVEAVSHLRAGSLGIPLSSRVGIATGQVVVGDISGEQDAIVGRTANLAARLEGVAEPGSVVIDEATTSLVTAEVELGSPALCDLKGFDEPVATFPVLRAQQHATRFEAGRGDGSLTPFVGRRAELALLQDAWELAAGGEGRFVTIGGEAGIGKSRLVFELIASTGTDRDVWHLQCSPEQVSSVLHPVARRIELAAGLASASDIDGQRELLREYLADWSDRERAFSAIAGLLGVEPEREALQPDPARRREELLEILTAHLEEVTSDRPVLMVVEDLHWGDQTTLELVHRLAGRIRSHPVLIIVTHRPEFDITTLGTDRLTSLMIDRLPATHGRELVRALLGTDADDETVESVVDRTDGNPLFIEEFAPLASGLGLEDLSEVPASLQASLVAQIDRLHDAKRVAQVAAVIGREFSRDVLEVVLADDDATDPIAPLFEAGIVQPSAFAPGEFVFKHALVRDAAYGTLLSSDRRMLHKIVAEALSASPLGATAPESLARHFAAADQWHAAAQQFHAAGRRAIETGGLHEARDQFEAALDAVHHCEAGDRRDANELKILLDLAPVVMTVDTYASATAKEHYERAEEVAYLVGDRDRQFTAMWGAYYVGEVQAQWKQAAVDIAHLLQLDTTGLRHDLPIQIHHAAATWASSTGDLQTALRHDRAALAMYDRELHADHRFRFGGHDPAVCAHGQMGLALALVGSPDDALDAARRGVDLARALDHPPTTALALWFFAWTLYELDQFDDARPAIAELMTFCEQHAARAVARSAEILRLATLADRERSFAAFHSRIERMRERDQRGFLVPMVAACAAEAALDNDRIEDALLAVAYGEHVANESGELSYLGTLRHLHGRALEAGGQRDADMALTEHRAALDICRQQGRHWTGLLPAERSARLLAERGERSQAIDVLTTSLATFPDDLHRPRIERARGLLTELS